MSNKVNTLWFTFVIYFVVNHFIINMTEGIFWKNIAFTQLEYGMASTINLFIYIQTWIYSNNEKDYLDGNKRYIVDY